MLGLAACSESDVSVTGIRLDNNTLTLTVGQTGNLTATVLPENATNRNVAWQSNNTAVATVNTQGVVTAVSAGTATITVRTVDGGREATATVTVNAAIVAVTGVTLAPTTLSLPVGESETLTATVAPATATNQDVTWKSSDEAIAEVDDDGVVTAISAGTATITVTTVDGEHTATSTVTVTIPVTSVQIDRQKLWLIVDESETISASVFPHYATNQNISWEIADTDIATVDANGLVTAVAVGTTTITVTTEDGGFTDTIPVEVEDPTSLVDEGVVINGIRWATRNVNTPGTFARNPESAGMFYQWNSRIGWSSVNPLLSSDGNTTWNIIQATGISWETDNDPCPTGWRVPTIDELNSLRNTVHIWTTINGVNGRLFGNAPNQVFLPAAGLRDGSEGVLQDVNAWGSYWSSTQSGSNAARGLFFMMTSVFMGDNDRISGYSVRCVATD